MASFEVRAVGSCRSDTVTDDVGRAATACPPSAVAGGILGAVDAYLSAGAGRLLSEEWKEGLRDAIRSAAAREQTSRAQLARRATQLAEQSRELADQLREAMVALE